MLHLLRKGRLQRGHGLAPRASRRSLSLATLVATAAFVLALVAGRALPALAAGPENNDPGCPLPSEIGAASWFLASMPYIDICAYLSGPAAPAETPEPTASPSAPAEHVVAEGETLSEIALSYGMTAEELAELNGIDPGNVLSIGMRLLLTGGNAPGGEEPGSAPCPVIQASACAPHTTEHALILPFEASRAVILDDVLYLLSGGSLYRLPLSQIPATASILEPELVQPAERIVEGIRLQELMDLAVDDTAGELVLINKVGDLFGFRPSTGLWSVRMVGESIPGLWLDPQFVAITQMGSMTYGLDIDGARLWRLPAGASYPELEREGAYIARAIDLAALDGQLYLVNANGTLVDGSGSPYAADLPRLGWPADLASSDDALLALDGDGRRVIVLGEGDPADIQLQVAGVQRLRTAARADGVIYVVAGSRLYRIGAVQEASACASVPRDDRWLFNGVDLLAGVPELTLPFEGGILPARPRSFPGARRMYRYGIHEGVDFYAGDAPGLAYGSPVGAIASGTIIRIDHDFSEMTPEAYGPVMAEIEGLHATPDHLLDKLRGQQVWVQHARGVVSRYAHLSRVASDLQVGDQVEVGQTLGYVGVSGTSDGVYRSTSGYHLHWEIWLDGQYLGFGLTIPETMRLWRLLF
ncbi:MAG: peptidoglycan DD-metalloendopeptidase family protein [Chloroflexi bacterium]|nr:peptidoglycan DD-metalloendopeptidase family protein [Chloroflexota bacterium]